MAADRTTGRLSRLAPVVLGALLVALLIVAGLLGFQLRAAEATEDRRTAILQAARQHTLDFTTLHHRSFDRNAQRVLDGATGAFAKQYRQSTEQLRSLVTDSKSVSKGEVLSAGVVTADADSARVIVVADSTVTNKASPQPQQRHYRLQLDLVRDGTRWPVSELRFVS